MRPGNARHRRERLAGGDDGGFTYLVLMFAIAITSAGFAVTAQSVAKVSERGRIEQLQWVGEQYREAIGRYYEGTPGSVKRYPAELEDLILDKRYLTVRRHIRKLYGNPLTEVATNGALSWNLVRGGDGGITGISTVGTDGKSYTFVYRPPMSGGAVGTLRSASGAQR